VLINLARPQKENERPRYEVSLITEGYHPELDNQSLTLKLETISGDVLLSVAGIPDAAETRFTAILHDDKWWNMEWFNLL
jgi:hypothetical protein